MDLITDYFYIFKEYIFSTLLIIICMVIYLILRKSLKLRHEFEKEQREIRSNLKKYFSGTDKSEINSKEIKELDGQRKGIGFIYNKKENYAFFNWYLANCNSYSHIIILTKYRLLEKVKRQLKKSEKFVADENLKVFLMCSLVSLWVVSGS